MPKREKSSQKKKPPAPRGKTKDSTIALHDTLRPYVNVFNMNAEPEASTSTDDEKRLVSEACQVPPLRKIGQTTTFDSLHRIKSESPKICLSTPTAQVQQPTTGGRSGHPKQKKLKTEYDCDDASLFGNFDNLGIGSSKSPAVRHEVKGDVPGFRGLYPENAEDEDTVAALVKILNNK